MLLRGAPLRKKNRQINFANDWRDHRHELIYYHPIWQNVKFCPDFSYISLIPQKMHRAIFLELSIKRLVEFLILKSTGHFCIFCFICDTYVVLKYLCIFMCAVNFDIFWNPLLHTVHLYGSHDSSKAACQLGRSPLLVEVSSAGVLGSTVP